MSILEKVASFFVETKFHLVVFLTAIVLILFAFFSGISTSNGNFGPIIRDRTNVLLLIVGTLAMAGSFFVYIHSLNHEAPKPPQIPPSQPELSSMEPKELKEPGSIDLSEELVDNIDKTYLALSNAQKLIVINMYTSHKPEIPLGDFHDDFEKKLPGVIGSLTELRYRVKDLVHQGLLRTKKVGPRTTILICIPDVAQALSRRERILT